MGNKLVNEATHLKPLVSIVIPIYNDEEFLARALDSCINQTLTNIEIICVDDASTDSSREVINQYIKKDSRINLIEQPENMSALQARRVGVEAASGDYILFLDGDDEIDSETAELSYIKALKYKSDLVVFGIKIPKIMGRNLNNYEESLMPKYDILLGEDIIKNLFSVSGNMRGQTGGCLYRTKLLKDVYKNISNDSTAYRHNDQIITFAFFSLADRYVSIKKKLYTYHLSDGDSSKKNIDYKKFLFYAGGIQSVKILEDLVDRINIPKNRTDTVNKSLTALRYAVISAVANHAANNTKSKYRGKAIDYVVSNIDSMELAISLGSFKPQLLSVYTGKITPQVSRKNEIKHIALMSTNLNTGGLSGVLISQARYLSESGYKVSIFTHKEELQYKIPKEIEIVSVSGEDRTSKLISFKDSLVERKIDAIIDHSIFYNTAWASYITIANILGLKTIGWIHSFSLRNAHDLNLKGSYLRSHLGLLDRVVVLSKKDVSYWKMLGYKDIYYLPNPPSPLLLDYPIRKETKQPPVGTINILWFGRLQQRTKRVYELFRLANKLYQSTNNFKISIVGPESDDVTYEKFQNRIDKLGLNKVIELKGPRYGQDLIDIIDEAHMLVYTSDIEGYPLVLTEAQSHGLPIVMYNLPWLAITENNSGLHQVEWGDVDELAQHVLEIYNTPSLYKKMSSGSIKAAKEYMSYDFGKLYKQLIDGRLDNKLSPEPSSEDAGLIIEQYEKYSEYNAKRYIALEKKYENIKNKKKLARRQVKLEKARLNSVKKSYSHKVGLLITKPIKRTKRMVIKVRNRL